MRSCMTEIGSIQLLALCPSGVNPTSMVKGVRGPHIDHKHGTKTFRGVLHANCNTAIGLLREDPVLPRRAARYVETGGRFDDYAPGLGTGLL